MKKSHPRLSAPGAERLVGRVVRASTSYDLTVDWKDDAGDVLFTDLIATGAAAGTETNVDVLARPPHCMVAVADAGTVTATLSLR